MTDIDLDVYHPSVFRAALHCREVHNIKDFESVSDVFEKMYNVTVVSRQGSETREPVLQLAEKIIFPSEEDRLLFLLKWS